jgi:hypothetical protein
MLRTQAFVGAAGAALLLFFPGASFSADNLAALEVALRDIEHALEVLNGIEERSTQGELVSSAMLRGLTEAPGETPSASDQKLEALRDQVSLLQAELDVLETGPAQASAPVADLAPAAPLANSFAPSTKEDLAPPPVATGLSLEQRALLMGESPAYTPELRAAAPTTRTKLGAEPAGQVAADPAAAEAYSADRMRHAETCLRAGRYKEGFALIAALTDPAALSLQARFLEKLGRLDEAIKTLETVVPKLEGFEARRAQSDLEFYKWKRDFLTRLPPEAPGGGEHP